MITSFMDGVHPQVTSVLTPLPTLDSLSAIAFGLDPRFRRVTASGNNADVDTGAQEDVWTGGGMYPWLTAATNLELVSTSASDAAAGVGARTVTITGLNIDYNEITATVTLNGLTAVPVGTAFFRINSVVVASAGTTKTNVGDVTLRDLGAGTTRAVISAGFGVNRQSQYTVPAGYTLNIYHFILCINRPTSVRDATFGLYVQSPGGVYQIPVEVTVDGNPYTHTVFPGVTVQEKFDVGLRITSLSTDNTNVTGLYTGLLRRNT